ncbi:MAG: alpha/beta fold hydrolase [Saprospiraceae bacterium]
MKYIFLFFISSVVFFGCSSSSHLTTYGMIGKDKSLFYYHTGTGEPVVFIHGGPGLNHSYFLPYTNRLASSYHLIYYDQKSCGQSEIPSDTNAMRLDAFVNDIETIRQKFGLKKIHLLGHSWGSMLAIKYALKYPQNLSSLILINPAATSSQDVREASKIINRQFDNTDQMNRTMIIESTEFKSGSPKAMEKLFRLGFRQNMAQKNLADSIQLNIPEDFAKRNGALKYLFRDLADYDLYPSLKNITTPTLIIEGDQDVGLGASEKIRTEISMSTYKIIKDAGHFTFIEQPAAFDSIIKTFIGSLNKPVISR